MSENRPRVIINQDEEKHVSMGEHVMMQDGVEFSDPSEGQVNSGLYLQARRFLESKQKGDEFLSRLGTDDLEKITKQDLRKGSSTIEWPEGSYEKLVDTVAVGMSTGSDVVLPQEFQNMGTLSHALNEEIKDLSKERNLTPPTVHSSLDDYLRHQFEKSTGLPPRDVEDMIKESPEQLPKMDNSYQSLTGRTMSDNLKSQHFDDEAKQLDDAMPPQDPKKIEHLRSFEEAKQKGMEQDKRRLDGVKNEPEVPRVIINQDEEKHVSMGEHVMMQDGVEFSDPSEGQVNSGLYLQARRFLESKQKGDEFLSRLGTDDLEKITKQDLRKGSSTIEWPEGSYEKLVDTVAVGMSTGSDVVLPQELQNMGTLSHALNNEIKDFSKERNLTPPTVHSSLDDYLEHQFDKSMGRPPRDVEDMIKESPEQLPKMDNSYQSLTGRSMSDNLKSQHFDEEAKQLDDAMPTEDRTPKVAQKYLQGVKDQETEKQQQIGEVKGKRQKEVKRDLGLDN